MDRNEEPDEEPDFATREEWAAAAEARAIGGDSPAVGGVDDEPIDEALRPVYEAGGGESEGFELAERDLIRNATHDDGRALPALDAFTAEHESDRATAEYAEADQEEPPDL